MTPCRAGWSRFTPAMRARGRASAQATRQLKGDPLALMLRAQSAQLTGDFHGAIQAYQELAQREDTRVLGLRGLHAEASRRGDDEAAHSFRRCGAQGAAATVDGAGVPLASRHER